MGTTSFESFQFLPSPESFKVGDIVTITIFKETPEHPICTAEMVEVAKRGEVHEVVSVGSNVMLSCGWYWRPEWLAHAAHDYDSL